MQDFNPNSFAVIFFAIMFAACVIRLIVWGARGNNFRRLITVLRENW